MMRDANNTLGLLPGFHDNVAEEDYHADLLCAEPTLSRSVARLLLDRSPLHAWTAHPRLNPAYVPEQSEALEIGRAAHALALLGEDICAVIDAPDWRSAAAREARDAARAAGRIPVLPPRHKMICDMAEAVRPYLVAVREAKREVTAIWRDAGVLCRARFDGLSDDPNAPVWDYKTTVDASPGTFARAVWRYGYDLQAAWYSRGYKVLTNRAPAGFIFIAQEKTPPYAVTLHKLTPEAYEYAERRCGDALSVWSRCIELDDWPSYEPVVHEITAPPWSAAGDDDIIFPEDAE